MQLDPSCADTRGGRRDSAHLAPNPFVIRIRIAARVLRRIGIFSYLAYYTVCFLPEVRRLNPRDVIQLRNEVKVHEFLLNFQIF